MASALSVWTNVSKKFDGAFISFKTYISRDQHSPTSRNANLSFIVLSLLTFLQIKSQGNAKDYPFLTHPKTWNLAIAMLLLYGLAYDAEQRYGTSHPSCANVARRVMGLFGSVLMASLASILFPSWVQPLLYVVYVLFYADELIDWIMSKFVCEHEDDDTPSV